MRRVDRLTRRARESAGWRGHTLGRFSHNTYPASARVTADARCRTCGAWVQVDTRPPANGIDVAGSAVAVNCPA